MYHTVVLDNTVFLLCALWFDGNTAQLSFLSLQTVGRPFQTVPIVQVTQSHMRPCVPSVIKASLSVQMAEVVMVGRMLQVQI